MRLTILFATICCVSLCGCLHKDRIVVAPDTTFLITDTVWPNSVRISVYDRESNSLHEVPDAVPVRELVGWTGHKFNWAEFLHEQAKNPG